MPTLASAAAPRKGFAPPPEAPRYFSEKGLRPAFSWLDVWLEEHAHAFTVAKVTELEMLATFKASIETAIAKGQTFETWREGLKPELQARGWWGPREVADPTGARGSKTVDISAPRRMRTIFDTNMRTARAAGQWERIQKSTRALPHLLYVRTTSGEPRKAHLAFVGLVLPVDDAFWRTHFPPNGWGCKCAVRQISVREAQRYLATPGYTDDPGKIVWQDFVNARTGAVERVPAGIDPGFGWNPGMARDRQRKLAEMLGRRLHDVARVEELEAAARRVVVEIVEGPTFEAMHAQASSTGVIREGADRLARSQGLDKAARLKARDEAARFMRIAQPVAVLPPRLDHLRRALSPVVTVSEEAIGHSVKAHPTAAAEWSMAQRALDFGEVQVAGDDVDRVWAFADDESGRGYCVVLVWRAGGWRVNTLFPIKRGYRERQAARPERRILLEAEDAR